MQERKRIIAEKNTRHIVSSPISTPFLSAHGMSAAQINKINKTITNKRIGTQRPTKVYRPLTAISDILLKVPMNTGKISVEYPTPSWFTSTEKADVSIIIPMYKSHNVLGDLLASWSFNHDLKWEIIFVDDHCPNNSKEVVLQQWQRHHQLRGPVGRIIFNMENKGYGSTCNTGAEHATGDYLIFLNADTKVTPGWIEPIVNLLRCKEIGLVGNLQLKEGGMWDGYIDSAGSEWNWQQASFDHIGRHSYCNKILPEPMKPELAPIDVMYDGTREMVTGCCFGVRRDLFRYVGGFNVNYRIGYWEDAELSLFIRELGYKIVFTNKSVIYHKLGHTQSGAHSFAQFNKVYFQNRWVNSGRIDSLVKDKRKIIPEVRSILLRRSGANGDVLVAAGVASALKNKHKNCQVLFQTDCPEILHRHPYIDRVITHEPISERQFQVFYDLDMVYEYRPTANILTAYAECVGVKTELCNVCISTESFDVPNDCVAIHAGNTAWSGRNWQATRFIETANRLKQLGYTIICIGSSGDATVPCDFDLRGRTSVAQLAHVLQHCKLFVGIDSLPMHIAQAVRTPGVCFFGSIEPATRIYRDNMHGIAANIPCIGCHHRKAIPCVVTNTCETIDEQCISLVTTDMMMDKITTILT
jgi:GT2 family glycosyltransferase